MGWKRKDKKDVRPRQGRAPCKHTGKYLQPTDLATPKSAQHAARQGREEKCFKSTCSSGYAITAVLYLAY